MTLRRQTVAITVCAALVACSEPTDLPPSAEAPDDLPEFRWIPGLFGEREPNASIPAPLGFDESQFGRWHRSHGDDGSTKFAHWTQIDRENVGRLELAWSFDGTRHADGSPVEWQYPVQANPIVADGLLYVPSADDSLVALDARTGALRWEYRAAARPAHRGLVYWPGDAESPARLYFTAGKELIALDARSGAAIPSFGDGGSVRIPKATAAPAVHGDQLLVAINKPASLRSFDLRTGAPGWEARLLRYGGHNSGCSPWGGFSVDARRGLAFVTTGNPRPSMYGPGRIGDNLHCNSVVAIDTDDGEIAWAFQEVAHDLWNLDIAAPPALATVEIDGQRVDVVAAATKLGNTLLLERSSGTPLFDYRLRRAPRSQIPGEVAADYQPDLVLPEPLIDAYFDPQDVSDIGPQAQESIAWQIEDAALGFFPPPELGRAAITFGLHGGAEWPGVAVDPDRGWMFAPVNSFPWKLRFYVTTRSPSPLPDIGSEPHTLYLRRCMECHGRTRAKTVLLESEFGRTEAPSLIATAISPDYRDAYQEDGFWRRHARVLDERVPQSELDMLRRWFEKLDRDLDEARQLRPDYHAGELLDHEGYPGSRPPWGQVVALDLHTGQVRWRVPFGEYPELTARGLPATGQPNFGGLIATRGGLLFATGTLDEKLRALDSDTGTELWSHTLPASGSAPPTTYEIDGRQFVVVVAGGGRFHGFEPGGTGVFAFALPSEGR